MKKVFTLLCSALLTMYTNAQQPPFEAYYLKGEMETAAGFRLDTNGRFRFFFSYGALDRQATGTWKKEGDRLVLNSESKGVKDFQLIESKVNPGKQLTILVTGTSAHVLPYITATVKSKGKEFSATANSKGLIELPVVQADSIVLQFQWCPEKSSRYAAGKHNYFSFRILPSITDVVFDNFIFTITSQEIYGPLPFSGDHICHFQLAANRGE